MVAMKNTCLSKYRYPNAYCMYITEKWNQNCRDQGVSTKKPLSSTWTENQAKIVLLPSLRPCNLSQIHIINVDNMHLKTWNLL